LNLLGCKIFKGGVNDMMKNLVGAMTRGTITGWHAAYSDNVYAMVKVDSAVEGRSELYWVSLDGVKQETHAHNPREVK
ncbi:MAG: hypothetical protein NWF07_08265, partial [Candidatus Bathyarchaeota archaeon]|nr:hypothetical protein [Candidatus Bathyarchaeota archaeon]